jgi:site-specific DNA-methyltransferase (adenine-specific)
MKGAPTWGDGPECSADTGRRVSARAWDGASGPRRPWLLLQGDALDVAHSLRPGSIDLVYADPPFFTRRSIGEPRSPGRARAEVAGTGFDDRWPKGREDYVRWLAERVGALRDSLKPSGSLFLHLDWHAVHAVKVALDRVFGSKLFVNEIIWSYRTGGAGGRRLARKHDTILFYARSSRYKFHPMRERSDLAHRYGFSNADVRIDARGPYRLALMRDVWEIPALRGNSPERVAFPTQKPLALLHRILALATDPGDLVVDPFCGSGTTVVAAASMNRRAIGGDIAPAALDLTRRRLVDAESDTHSAVAQ